MRSLLLFLIACINLFLGLIILTKGKSKKYNIYYFLVVLSLSFWSLGVGMFYYNTDISFYDVFFVKVLYFFGSLISTSFLGFVLSFPKDKKINLKWNVLLFSPNFLLFYLIFITNNVIDSVYIDTFKKIAYGNYLFIFNIEFILILLVAYLILLKKYFLVKNKNSLLKKQLQYITIGTLISAMIGSFCNIILPALGNFSVFWVGPVSTIFMVGLFTYAITRYRLMDIRLVISKSILYVALVGIITFLFTTATLLTGEIFVDIPGVSKTLITLGVSLIIVIGIDPLKRFLNNITDKVFYRGKIDYQDVLRKLGGIIAKEIDLKKLLIDLSHNIEELLKYKEVDFLYKSNSSGIYRGIINNNEVITDKEEIVKYLEDSREIILTEELEIKARDKGVEEKKYLLSIAKRLRTMNIGLIAPIISENNIIAFLIINKKLSDDVFSTPDLNLISVMTPQIANALEKAKLYSEVQEFNVKLQEKVDKATGELKRANIDLKEANVHLKQLDEAKSEFLSIASHQLRTPLTGIKGYLSMILEGDYGKMDKKQEKIIQDVFNASDRMSRLINVFLNVSRIESGRLKLDYTDVNLGNLINECIKDLHSTAQEKGLELNFKYQKNEIPLVSVDSDKMKDVVLNLIDNAIKYTHKGRIDIKLLKEGEDKILVQIKDTGIGLDQAGIEKLFSKFSRGDGISKINTGGSGLGLYIVKRIIEEHGGKAWVESDGVGKGSTFQFTLPINK
jgi:signal transduction histidine kinase